MLFRLVISTVVVVASLQATAQPIREFFMMMEYGYHGVAMYTVKSRQIEFHSEGEGTFAIAEERKERVFGFQVSAQTYVSIVGGRKKVSMGLMPVANVVLSQFSVKIRHFEFPLYWAIRAGYVNLNEGGKRNMFGLGAGMSFSYLAIDHMEALQGTFMKPSVVAEYGRTFDVFAFKARFQYTLEPYFTDFSSDQGLIPRTTYSHMSLQIALWINRDTHQRAYHKLHQNRRRKWSLRKPKIRGFNPWRCPDKL